MTNRLTLASLQDRVGVVGDQNRARSRVNVGLNSSGLKHDLKWMHVAPHLRQIFHVRLWQLICCTWLIRSYVSCTVVTVCRPQMQVQRKFWDFWESLKPGVWSPVYRLQCECQHNTCGESCDRCCPGFNQKPWRAATVDSPNECHRKCTSTMLHTVCKHNHVLFLPTLLAPWITTPRVDWSVLWYLSPVVDVLIWYCGRASVKSWEGIPHMVCVMNSTVHD